MKRNKQLFSGLLLMAFAVLVTGCGGFQGSRSISPATFLLPGLGQVPSESGTPVSVSTPSATDGLLAAQ